MSVVVIGNAGSVLKTFNGEKIKVDFDSICLHGDTKGALDIAKSLNKSFAENNPVHCDLSWYGSLVLINAYSAFPSSPRIEFGNSSVSICINFFANNIYDFIF